MPLRAETDQARAAAVDHAAEGAGYSFRACLTCRHAMARGSGVAAEDGWVRCWAFRQGGDPRRAFVSALGRCPSWEPNLLIERV